ncbi:L,D-transpeptidase [Polaromonas glacialis]|uniref:L,D-transpeptidase n=1 Tax=Polaromonas glacialis TaxID=866564 RepID=UPI001E401E8B|nr:L,D-transpeptidase [Polaromonas glacialis]
MNACPLASPLKTRFPPWPRTLAGALLVGGLVALLGLPQPSRAATPAVLAAENIRLQPLSVGQDVPRMTAWIRATRNHQGLPFAVIDKKAAMLHVFDAAGSPLGSSPVLLGLAVGDDSAPGIGTRKLADIRPDERTTPAGRFVSEPGRNLQGEDIVWIDYDAAVSMHRVRASNKADRRLERLATPTAADNRISYGCVNVPAAFYDALVKPVFGARPAVIYVLPETRPVGTLLGLGDGSARDVAPLVAAAP